jgi:transcription elongation factor GreB
MQEITLLTKQPAPAGCFAPLLELLMTNLISAEGLKNCVTNMIPLKVERPKVVRGFDAAAEGDCWRMQNTFTAKGCARSTATETLGSRLKVLKVATVPTNPKQVTFGCWVTYEEEGGDVVINWSARCDRCQHRQNQYGFTGRSGSAAQKADDEVIVRKPVGEMTVYYRNQLDPPSSSLSRSFSSFSRCQRAETSRMMAATPSIIPDSSFTITIENSVEIRVPSLRKAGAASISVL